jgi:hypothetical protein
MAKGIEAFKFDASNGLFEVLGEGDFSRAQDLLGLLPEQVQAAAKAATTKVGRWAEREGSKRLAVVAKLSVKQLRTATRFKFRFQNKDGNMRGSVWFGLNDVAVKWAGATQTKGGVSSPAGYFPGAFISQKLKGHVFRRKTKAPLPLELVKYEIVGSAEAVLATVALEAARMFQQMLFEQLDALTGKGAGTSQAILGA